MDELKITIRGNSDEDLPVLRDRMWRRWLVHDLVKVKSGGIVVPPECGSLLV